MPQKKKPYRSKIKIGVDADGRDINKWYRGATREEMAANRQRMVETYITGEALAADRLLGDYAVEWYHLRKEPFASPSTRENYRTVLNKNILPAFGDRNMRAITARELQAFLNSFAGMSQTKITLVLSALRGIFQAAYADRLIAVDPTDHLLRPRASDPKTKPVLAPAQRAAVEATCAAHPSGHYLALMYYLGVRPGEARGLQWGDIDWEHGRIRIQRDIDYKDGAAPGPLKTRKSARLLPLPAPLRDILYPIRSLPQYYIACGESPDRPLAKTSAERLWLELMQAAGLARPLTDEEKQKIRWRSSDPRAHFAPLITPHALRHNYATLCWEHGFDPYTTMKLMGHASIKTTMDIYTHLSETQLQETAAQVDDMFAQQKKPGSQRKPG